MASFAISGAPYFIIMRRGGRGCIILGGFNALAAGTYGLSMTEAEKVRAKLLQKADDADRDHAVFVYCITPADLRAALYAHPPAQAPTDAEMMERAAKAIHEARSTIPWEVTSQQDLAYRDARAAIAALTLPKAKASGDVELRKRADLAAYNEMRRQGFSGGWDHDALVGVIIEALSRPEAGGKEAANDDTLTLNDVEASTIELMRQMPRNGLTVSQWAALRLKEAAERAVMEGKEAAGEGEGCDIVERAAEIARASYDAIRPTGSKFWGELDDMTQTLAIVSARDALQSLPARHGVDREELTTAIAQCFLRHPKEMPWEDRSEQLADAVIAFLNLEPPHDHIH